MGTCTHPSITGWSQRGDFRGELPRLTEELLRPVAAHPLLEQPQVSGIFPHLVDWNLMSAPKSFDLLAVDLFRTRPAFRTSQDDERPTRSIHPVAIGAWAARLPLNGMDIIDHLVQNGGHALMHRCRLRSCDHKGLVPVAVKQADELLVLHSSKDSRVGDLIAVEMKNRQYGAIRAWIEKFIAMPGSSQRTGFRRQSDPGCRMRPRGRGQANSRALRLRESTPA